MRRLAIALAVLLVSASSAYAYYATAQSTGTARVRADVLPAGPTPTVQLRGRTATISWSAVPWPNGDPVQTYAVSRGAGGCTVTALTCTETGLPTGTWRYAVTARAGTSWAGAAGPLSAPITVPAPALALDRALVGGGLPQTLGGSLTGFDTGEALTFRVDGAAITATPAAATVDGTASPAVTLPAGVADGAHVVSAVGGGGTQASASLVVDLTPPVTTDSSAAVGSAWRPQATVALTATDVTSGVAATYWSSDGSAPSTPGTAVPLTADGVYTVRYQSVDHAGNREAVRAAATPIRIDATAPIATAPATGGTIIANGRQLTAGASDPSVNGASSGVASVAYYACPGACTPTAASIPIGSSTAAPSYPVTWATQPADGTYSLSARATDAAGNVGWSPVIQRVVDNSPPQIATDLADATVRQAGDINGNADFHAYANVVDAGAGVDAATIKADLSAQCGSSCASVALSSAGGPFTLLTAAGTVTYTYRSAVLRASGSPTTAYSVTAADLGGLSATKSGSVVIDLGGKPGNPAAVALTSGVAATDFTTCATTVNGYVNAARAASATVQVTTGVNSPANGVVSLSAGAASAMVVVPAAGAQTVTLPIDLSGLADGPVTLSAVEYTPGGKQVSTPTTQTVTKLTAAPAVAIANLVYADNTAPLADQASSTLAAGPANGFLAFTQTAGTHVGAVFRSAVLTGGRLAPLNLASETAGPTYAVSAVDAACNQGPTATWTPSASR